MNNQLGYYQAAQLPTANVHWTGKKKLLHVDNNRLVVCVAAQLLKVVFNNDTAEIPKRQWLRFKVLREIDKQVLDDLCYARQNPPKSMLPLNLRNAEQNFTSFSYHNSG